MQVDEYKVLSSENLPDNSAEFKTQSKSRSVNEPYGSQYAQFRTLGNLKLLLEIQCVGLLEKLQSLVNVVFAALIFKHIETNVLFVFNDIAWIQQNTTW